mmetsp:Transcript_1426/g.2102  ORF Transcript_1426/g.2102 Transcript_1426/m.2102 type:complete len:301 (-) Transcript_1426:149-1051(-)
MNCCHAFLPFINDEPEKEIVESRHTQEEVMRAHEDARQAKEELERVKRTAAEEAEKSRAELVRLQKEIEEARNKHPDHGRGLDLKNSVMISKEEANLLEEVKWVKEEQERAQAEASSLKRELEEAKISFMMEIKNAHGESEALRQRLEEVNKDKSSMEAAGALITEDEFQMFKDEIKRLNQDLEEKEMQIERMEHMITEIDSEQSDSASETSSLSNPSQLNDPLDDDKDLDLTAPPMIHRKRSTRDSIGSKSDSSIRGISEWQERIDTIRVDNLERMHSLRDELRELKKERSLRLNKGTQ